jgi:P-type Ca2+ transporter type 2C
MMGLPMKEPVASPAHARAALEVAASLDVDPEGGLAPDEAAARLAHHGPNELEEHDPPSVWKAMWEALTEPFVILLAAAGVGAVALGEVRDGVLVLIGLVPIVGADVATTYRSERALEELREAVAMRAHVLRGGARTQVVTADVVPGDVLLLAAGDVVPADARVLPGGSLLVDRSVLTGESVPEHTRSEPDAAAAPIAERRAMVYAGTSIVGGRGTAVTIATGRETELGSIAGSLTADPRRRSPLQRELDRLVRILLVVAIGLIVITVGLGFLRGQPVGANILAGISAAIAAIPEEPPVLLAVILGLGAYRLMRRNVLVRRLAAQEALGAVDLIVTDKTGTLTRNQLVVEEILRPDVPIDAIEADALLVEALSAEDDAWDGAAGRRGSFTRAIEQALVERGTDASLDPSLLISASGVEDGRPFSSVRYRRDGGWRETALGAPEAVMALAALADDTRARGPWRRLVSEEAGRGGRLLLLARRDEGEAWTVRAVIRFGDAIREEVPEAVDTATRAGIQTVMVTGDHPETAAAIADAVGFPSGEGITGPDLDGITDAELAARLPALRVVARAEPGQKLRLVQVAQASGRSVAVTGDGVNDAPALQAADVAVSMGSGTAVAREASDLVLGDDSFATMMGGLREGRRIVANVQKGLVFIVSTHVALLGFILIATIAGFGQPLLPIQILWIELFIDLSASVAFEREPEEPGTMARPPRPRSRPLLDNAILVRIAVAGGFSAVAALAILLAHPGPFEHARWVAVTMLVVAQAVRAYANRSLRQPVFGLAANRFLAVVCVIVIAAQAAIPFVPPLADAFRATPLSAVEWLIAGLVALTPAVVAEVIRARSGKLDWVA